MLVNIQVGEWQLLIGIYFTMLQANNTSQPCVRSCCVWVAPQLTAAASCNFVPWWQTHVAGLYIAVFQTLLVLSCPVLQLLRV